MRNAANALLFYRCGSISSAMTSLTAIVTLLISFSRKGHLVHYKLSSAANNSNSFTRGHGGKGIYGNTPVDY